MKKRTANDVVILAGARGCLITLEYIEIISGNFLEFHGDRYLADSLAVVGGVATLRGKPVTVVGIQKGRNLPENIEHDFGSPSPEGYREVLRLARQTERFNHPVTTFVDTVGAYYGVDVGKRGEGEAITQSLLEMSGLKVSVISVIIGKGGSNSTLALVVVDKVQMLEYTICAVLSPGGFTSILWRGDSCTKETTELMKVTVTELKELAIVNKIIPEVMSDQPLKQAKVNCMLRRTFISRLTELAELDAETLLKKGYQRSYKY